MNLNITKDFDDKEQALVEASHTDQTAIINRTRVIAAIYVARMNRESTQALIEANKEMSKASERYAKSLNQATWGLVWATSLLFLVGIMQVIIAYLQHS